MWTENILQLLEKPIQNGADIATAVKDLFQSLAEESCKIVPASIRSSIRILQEKEGTLRIEAVDGEGWKPEIVRVITAIDHRSAGAYAVRTKKPFLIEDVHQTEHYLGLFADTRSHVSVPFFWRKQKAVLSLDSVRLGAFTNSDVLLLQDLVARALTVLEHLALIEDVWLLELEKFLSNSVSLSSLNVKSLCEGALDYIRRLFGVRGCSIFLLYPRTAELRLGATTMPSISPYEVPTYPVGQGLTGWVAKHRKSLRLRDVADPAELAVISDDLTWSATWSEVDYPGPKAFLAAPLLVQAALVGVVRMGGKRDDYLFTSYDESLLESIASRLALAIQNIWLREQTQIRVKLAKLGTTLAAKLDSHGVSKAILDEALDIFGCNSGHIRVIDRSARGLRLLTSIGRQTDKLPPLRLLGEGISGKVALDKDSIVIDDLAKDKERLVILSSTNAESEEEVLKWMRSLACLPLISEGEVVGTLNLHSSLVGAFSTIKQELLLDLANRAAVAIKAALIFEESKQLLHFLRNISLEYTRQVDVKKLLTEILLTALKLSGARWGTVRRLSDGGDKWILMAAVDRSDPKIEFELKAALPVRDDILGHAKNNPQAKLVPDASSDEEFGEFLKSVKASEMHLALLGAVRSFLIVPMWLKESVGFVFLGFDATFDVPESTVQFLETLAAEGAVALENARLNRPLLVMGGMLGSFLHTLRSPLHRITGVLDNMDQSDSSQRTIRKEVRHLIRVLEEVKLFAGKGAESVREPVDINTAVRKAVDERTADFGESVKCKMELCSVDPTVLGNRIQLQQALGLVILNAIEAMPDGGMLTIQTSMQTGGIAVSFRDTGLGMDAKARANCLKPFFSTKPGGSGLGLTIVHHVVASHGGTLEIDSAVGRGTTISLRLPLKEDSDASIADLR